jgi:general L-amino acid transport system substrate-binding protein
VLGNVFAGVTYYDGQGFLVRKSGGARTIADLVGLRICVLGGSSAQQVLTEAFHVRGQAFQPVVKDTLGEALDAYRKRQCDALSDDVSVLTGARSRLNNASDQLILPGFIADEPLGLMVAEDDGRWAEIVRWTLNALVLAEDLKVGSANAEQLRKSSDNPAIRRLLGVDGEFGRRLGLADDWSFRAIRQGGDYGEIFERNLAPLGLERGRNALWDADRPGLIHAPPMR